MGKVKYSCCIDTVYALALYLLISDEKTAENTRFFVGTTMPKDMMGHFRHVVYMRRFRTSRWKLILFKILAIVKFWPMMYRTSIIGQDHLFFSAQIIGYKNYTLLEDSPGIFTTYKNFLPLRPLGRQPLLTRHLYRGPIYGQFLGTNKQCKNRIVTDKGDVESELLKGRNYTIVDLQRTWDEASERKKNFIKEVFGINDTKIQIWKQSLTLIITQPFMEDCGLTTEEMAHVYSSYIDKYRQDRIVIKPHPRDKFPYKEIFPSCAIMDCKAPMQLLTIMGVKFRRAITVCSSAITSMPADTEIIWIGAKIHPKILKKYSDVPNPWAGK